MPSRSPTGFVGTATKTNHQSKNIQIMTTNSVTSSSTPLLKQEKNRHRWRAIIALLALFLLPMTAFAAGPWKEMPSPSDLHFKALAHTWDEGMPLGNGFIGQLIWQKENKLRFSLDRTDLWDLRPTDSLSGKNFTFEWVKQHIITNNYDPVHRKLDDPYDQLAAPSKIPGAAIEFTVPGTVKDVRLYLKNALCRVEWTNGMTLRSFVQAEKPVGWFVFENVPSHFSPILVPPAYVKNDKEVKNAIPEQELYRLGYKQGNVVTNGQYILYHQEGWKGFHYDVAVRWQQEGHKITGVWCILSSLSGGDARKAVDEAWQRGVNADYTSHLAFWKAFRGQSSVVLPDSVLQRQYDNEMYKLGCVARENSYPISLQAVWTADNGKLPPWKGDIHHDLNTELSYWPVYTGNHLKEGMGYLNTMWNQRPVYRKFTKQYFGVDGLDIPGVCTLTGEPMGGWIQYSMSQTTSSWLAHHFYQQWKYSCDDNFMRTRAYPFTKEVATFIEHQLEPDGKGGLTFHFSTSPEVFESSTKAWFRTITNYDLSLIISLLKSAVEMSTALHNESDRAHWQSLLDKLPKLQTDENGAFEFAAGVPYSFSHRHFSHAMSIYPLGLIDWEDGEASRRTIRATIDKLIKEGPDWWCGYSYSWLACMYARERNGEGASKALHDFARCFCLPNTFHANGDQTKSGMSKFDYRPFTLEGNFAFAAGVQEMLLQSQRDVIRIFPAIPKSWANVSFHQLRAQGAFLVSAEQKDGKVVRLSIFSERGKTLRLVSPFDGKLITRPTKAGETIMLTK
jgi:alpha-L-fucosidase 2